MTFPFTPDEYSAKVQQLAAQGIVLTGQSGTIPVPGHPELTVSYAYADPTLTVSVTGGNWLERDIAQGKIKAWLS